MFKFDKGKLNFMSHTTITLKFKRYWFPVQYAIELDLDLRI